MNIQKPKKLELFSGGKSTKHCISMVKELDSLICQIKLRSKSEKPENTPINRTDSDLKQAIEILTHRIKGRKSPNTTSTRPNIFEQSSLGPGSYNIERVLPLTPSPHPFHSIRSQKISPSLHFVSKNKLMLKNTYSVKSHNVKVAQNVEKKALEFKKTVKKRTEKFKNELQTMHIQGKLKQKADIAVIWCLISVVAASGYLIKAKIEKQKVKNI